MDAWLITWGGPGNHAQVKNKVVAILSASKSLDEVVTVTESLYQQSTSTLEEMATYAEDKRHNPYPAHVSQNNQGRSSLTCGHNPYLEAHLVTELTVKVNEKTGEETVAWKQQVTSGSWLSKSSTQKR